MGSGWGFTLGLLAGEALAFMAVTGVYGRLSAAAKSVGQAAAALARRGRRSPSWTIGGRVYRPRRLSRAVMEQVVQVQSYAQHAHPAFAGMPLSVMLGVEGPDQDEAREEQIRQHASSIQAGYETCSLVLEDADGRQPTVELLSDELTFDEVTRILARILG